MSVEGEIREAGAEEVATRDFKKVLKGVVEFLNVADSEAIKLWQVLSALRGPDSESIDAKEASTSVIRHAIGLTDTGNLIINPDGEGKLAMRTDLDEGGWTKLRANTSFHFTHHTRQAFEVLGLKWDEVNPAKVVI